MKRAEMTARTLKQLNWVSVGVPLGTHRKTQLRWCHDSESDGQFCVRVVSTLPPGESWKYKRVWYFEQPVDAVLFALKFK